MHRTLLLVAAIPSLVLGYNASPNRLAARVEVQTSGVLGHRPTPIDEARLTKVRENLWESSKFSWEIGTEMQALIELYWPALSVFGSSPFPPTKPTESFTVHDVIALADEVMAKKPADVPAFEKSGTAGDPASLGIGVLYAGYVNGNESYFAASQTQLDHLLYTVPRYSNGAISHRDVQEPAQLWDDFIAMAPPFMAYFGALESNRTLLEIAYEQCKLYREAQRDETYNLWRHVIGGTWEDRSLWATGNAWAAWGMLRIHQTISHSSFGSELIQEQNDLLDWATEIVLSAWEDKDDEGLLFNTLGCDGPDDNFGDTAFTALIASVTYRLGQIYGDATKNYIEEHLPNKTLPADFPQVWSGSYTTAQLTLPPTLDLQLLRKLESALESADTAYTTISNSYLGADGWLLGTVDPLSWLVQLQPGHYSPEGQAFVLIMEAGRRDWYAWVDALIPTLATETEQPAEPETPSPQRKRALHKAKRHSH